MTEAIEPDGHRTGMRILPSCALFAFAFLWFSFWLFGQTFFDDDYSRWLLPYLDVPFSDVLGQVFRPIPDNWGFLDRPLIALVFKAVFAFAGWNPAPYFTIKAAVAALACLLVARLVHAAARDRGVRQHVAILAACLSGGVFVTAEPVFMGLLWLCDMDVLAQLLLLVSVALYMMHRRLVPAQRPGARGMLLQLAIAFFALLAFRTKASARLFPVLLFAHALWMDRKRAVYFIPLLILLCLPVVPWLHLQEIPLPEFLRSHPTSQTPTFFWASPSVHAFAGRLVGDPTAALPFRPHAVQPYGLIQVLFPFGLAAMFTAMLSIPRSGQGPTSPRPTASHGYGRLFLLWFILSVASLAIYPRVSRQLSSRYLVGPLVPTCLLLGLFLARALASASTARRAVLCLLVVGQVLAGAYDTRRRKMNEGARIMTIDRVRASVEDHCSGANVAYMFTPLYAYRPSTHGNSYCSLQGSLDDALSQLDRLSAASTNLYVVVNTPVQDPTLRLIDHIAPPRGLYGTLTGMARADVDKYLFYKAAP